MVASRARRFTRSTSESSHESPSGVVASRRKRTFTRLFHRATVLAQENRQLRPARDCPGVKPESDGKRPTRRWTGGRGHWCGRYPCVQPKTTGIAKWNSLPPPSRWAVKIRPEWSGSSLPGLAAGHPASALRVLGPGILEVPFGTAVAPASGQYAVLLINAPAVRMDPHQCRRERTTPSGKRRDRHEPTLRP